jgi:hypothetical protein
MNFWYWHKHDFYAAFLTAMAIVVFLGMSPSTPHAPPPGGPPSLGVWDTEATAPDKWATAGVTTSEATSTSATPQQQASRTEDVPVAPPLTPIPLTDEDYLPPQEAAGVAISDPATGNIVENDTVAEVSTRPVDTNLLPDQHHAPTAIVEYRPARANAVEDAPRPVEQMSEGEIQAAVNDYQRWLHRGQITIVLDYSYLSPQQIDQIAGVYVMETTGSRAEGTRLAITPSGAPASMSDDALGKLLIGDLVSDRQRWPPCVQAKIHWFGSNAALTTKMVLKDSVALQLYRILAEQAGTVQPLPGTVCRIQLVPVNQQIDVRLVGFVANRKA